MPLLIHAGTTYNHEKPFCIAEIGINHNGDLGIAKELIRVAKQVNFNAVKFQKLNVGLIYSPEELSTNRDSPFGTTFRQQKDGLKFDRYEYDEIDQYCRQLDMIWFASAWNLDSLEFLNKYNLPFNKVATPQSADSSEGDITITYNNTFNEIFLRTEMH